MRVLPRLSYSEFEVGPAVVEITDNELLVNLSRSDTSDPDFYYLCGTLERELPSILAYLYVSQTKRAFDRARVALDEGADREIQELILTWMDDPSWVESLLMQSRAQSIWGMPSGWSTMIQDIAILKTDYAVASRNTELLRLSLKFPAEHRGFVYLFKLSTGHYKIGFSRHPQRRGREITSGLPFTLKLIHQIASNQIACLEYELHEQYSLKRHHPTEWFTLDEDDVTNICSIPDRNYPWIDNPDWATGLKFLRSQQSAAVPLLRPRS